MRIILYFRIVFTFLLLVISSATFAQNKPTEKDWIEILSGNIATYKKLNIKTIKLLRDEQTINEINYQPSKNSLLVKNKYQEKSYLINNENNLISLSLPTRKHKLSYDDRNEQIEMYQIKFDCDSLVQSQSISFLKDNNSDMEFYQLEKKRKSNGKTVLFQSVKRIINPKDSLWSYDEIVNNKDIERNYLNKTKSKLKFESDQKYSYDSVYVYPNGNTYSLYDNGKGNQIERKIIKNDSIFEYSIKNGKTYRFMLRKGYNLLKDYSYEEETEKLLETIDYTYFPLAVNKELMLWKVSTYNYPTKTTIIEFPNKKFYKLKKNQIVKKDEIFKKWKLRKSFECGTGRIRLTSSTSNMEILKRTVMYQYDISSSSILVDIIMILKNMAIDDFPDIKQAYFHCEMPTQDLAKTTFTGIYKTGKIPNEFTKEILRVVNKINLKTFLRKDWKVEVTTYNNKKWIIDPNLYYNKLKLKLDFFIYDYVNTSCD